VSLFRDLHDFVAIPKLTALRLAPDGSWLAAAVQTVDAEGKKFVSSIWRIDASPAGTGRPAARLTRSAEGEGSPEFLPDGSLLFMSQRQGPAAAPAAGDDAAKDKAALWLLPAAGGEAIPIAAPPGGVVRVAAARDARSAMPACGPWTRCSRRPTCPRSGAGTSATRWSSRSATWRTHRTCMPTPSARRCW